MNLGIIKLVGEIVTIIAALGLVVWMFEKAGEQIGFLLSERTKLGTVIVGFTFTGILNWQLFYGHAITTTISQLDFGFLISFFPFCYGMYGGSKI